MAKGKKTGSWLPGPTNKNTRLVKDVFTAVFSDLQSDPQFSLKKWAKENLTEFYRIAARLIPTQVAGDPDSPIKVDHKITVEL